MDPLTIPWEPWWGNIVCRPDAHVFIWTSDTAYDKPPHGLRCCCGATPVLKDEGVERP